MARGVVDPERFRLPGGSPMSYGRVREDERFVLIGISPADVCDRFPFQKLAVWMRKRGWQWLEPHGWSPEELKKTAIGLFADMDYYNVDNVETGGFRVNKLTDRFALAHVAMSKEEAL